MDVAGEASRGSRGIHGYNKGIAAYPRRSLHCVTDPGPGLISDSWAIAKPALALVCHYFFLVKNLESPLPGARLTRLHACRQPFISSPALGRPWRSREVHERKYIWDRRHTHTHTLQRRPAAKKRQA